MGGEKSPLIYGGFMNQAVLDYLKGRVINAVPRISGEITTYSTITLDNGEIIEGCVMRDINNYNKEEAEAAAFQEAIKTFYPGVNLILTKA